MASFSALSNPWQPLLHPYRTRDLCPVDLCPQTLKRIELSAMRGGILAFGSLMGSLLLNDCIQHLRQVGDR
jgi:hypothetical protein